MFISLSVLWAQKCLLVWFHPQPSHHSGESLLPTAPGGFVPGLFGAADSAALCPVSGEAFLHHSCPHRLSPAAPLPPPPQTSGYRSMAPESTLSLNMGTRTTAPAASLWLPSVLFDRVLPGLSLVDAFSLSWPSAVHTGVTFLPVLQPP